MTERKLLKKLTKDFKELYFYSKVEMNKDILALKIIKVMSTVYNNNINIQDEVVKGRLHPFALYCQSALQAVKQHEQTKKQKELIHGKQ